MKKKKGILFYSFWQKVWLRMVWLRNLDYVKFEMKFLLSAFDGTEQKFWWAVWAKLLKIMKQNLLWEFGGEEEGACAEGEVLDRQCKLGWLKWRTQDIQDHEASSFCTGNPFFSLWANPDRTKQIKIPGFSQYRQLRKQNEQEWLGSHWMNGGLCGNWTEDCRLVPSGIIALVSRSWGGGSGEVDAEVEKQSESTKLVPVWVMFCFGPVTCPVCFQEWDQILPLGINSLREEEIQWFWVNLW